MGIICGSGTENGVGGGVRQVEAVKRCTRGKTGPVWGRRDRCCCDVARGTGECGGGQHRNGASSDCE